MAPQPANRTAHTRNAFTLVELMVVIVIIALLAALLMPVLSGAYRTAMKSADAALIHQIAMGCEAYNQVFHEYPPSGWSYDPAPAVANDPANVWPPPYAVPQQSIFGASGTLWPADNRPRLTGSGKVFAYLSGFNAIGCWDPTNAYTWNPAGWLATNPANNACGTLTYRGILVHQNPADNGTSEDKAYGPYYNPDDKGQTTTTVWWGANPAQQRTFASRFARQQHPNLPATGGIAEGGAPILYYRANPAPTGGVPANIFDFRDNYAITDLASSSASVDPYVLYDGTPGKVHPLYAFSNGATDEDFNIPLAQMITPQVTSPSDEKDYGIARPVTAGGSVTPYNANTFVLISPGPDGVYFTADDITNFRQ